MTTFQINTPSVGGSTSHSSLSLPLASYTHYSGHQQSTSSNQSSNLLQHYDQDEDEDESGDEFQSSVKSRIATPGQTVASSTDFMRGHGSYLSSTSSSTSAPLIVSSLAGMVHRVNKLVSVYSLRGRYVPEVGDLVVGRITDVLVGQKRWLVDIGSRSDAVLSLSSVNLPGGVQRRKLESDELQMRDFFNEGDLLVSEVQQVYDSGSCALHTRSLRYGKLRNGSLAIVPSKLIKRLRSHFVEIEKADTDVTLGLNGYIWISKHVKFDVGKAEEEGEGKGLSGTSTANSFQESKGLGGSGIGRDVDGVYSNVNEVSKISARSRLFIRFMLIFILL